MSSHLQLIPAKGHTLYTPLVNMELALTHLDNRVLIARCDPPDPPSRGLPWQPSRAMGDARSGILDILPANPPGKFLVGHV